MEELGAISRVKALNKLDKQESHLADQALIEEYTTSIARQEATKAILLVLTIFFAYAAKDWGLGGWGSGIVLIVGFIALYKTTSAEWGMAGRKLYEIRPLADKYGELRLLKKHWTNGSLKWKKYTDAEGSDAPKPIKNLSYIAPTAFDDSELFLLQADSIEQLMQISSNERKEKLKELRKELEPIFREARTYADSSDTDLIYWLKQLESMK